MSEPTERMTFTASSLPENYERHLARPLFAPWAELLLGAVRPAAGMSVVDVASGTGIVARAAARRVGPSGHVLATDVSPAMIAFNAAHPPLPGSAPIATAVAPVTELGRPDDTFDALVCQQGLQFFPDRAAAMREMRRVLRPGGVLGISVWSPGHDLAPFGYLNGALRDVGAPEPFPNAYDDAGYGLSVDQVVELLDGAGFTDVDARDVELVSRWPDPDALYAAVSGTPFGPVLDALDDSAKADVRERIARATERFAADGELAIPTYSVVARAVA